MQFGYSKQVSANHVFKVLSQRQVNFSFSETRHRGSPHFLEVSEGHCVPNTLLIQLSSEIMFRINILKKNNSENKFFHNFSNSKAHHDCGEDFG